MVTEEERLRQLQFLELVRTAFDNDNDAVAWAIQDITKERVSVRTIQAWSMQPGRASYRRVPDWALEGLATYLRQPGKAEELADRVARRRQRAPDRKSKAEWSDIVRTSMAVEYATTEIEHEAKERQLWRDLSGKHLGDKLFERFRALEKELASLSSAFGTLSRIIDESDDLAEVRHRFNEEVKWDALAKFHVRKARQAIEQSAEEFSNDEGRPPSATTL